MADSQPFANPRLRVVMTDSQPLRHALSLRQEPRRPLAWVIKPSHPTKAPLLSLTTKHHLHIFIFVLAVVHVMFCALTILFGGMKIRQWKLWEDSILNKEIDPEVLKINFTHVKEQDFIRDHFRGIGKRSALMGWLHSFFKQFYGSVTKSYYTTLRYGFIVTHFRGNQNFDFHTNQKKKNAETWYLWLFVVVFLLLNVYGWHVYFWIAFIPITLLLAVGTKLEHVMTQLAHEVAEKHVAVEGDMEVKSSDDHLVPQVQYKFESCIMGQVGYIIPRLVIGVFVQFVCSYSTLPLYAIATQMGSSYKGAIFEEHIQEGLLDWASKAKKKKGFRKAVNGSSQVVDDCEESTHSSMIIQLAEAEKVSAMEEGNAAGEIEPARK